MTHPATSTANLFRYVALQSPDDVKTDLELTCVDCNEHLCDIEPKDELGVLVAVALDHEDRLHRPERRASDAT